MDFNSTITRLKAVNGQTRLRSYASSAHTHFSNNVCMRVSLSLSLCLGLVLEPFVRVLPIVVLFDVVGVLESRLPDLWCDAFHHCFLRFGGNGRPNLAQAFAHEPGKGELAAAVDFAGHLFLVLPEVLEDDNCIDASALGPHLLHARGVPPRFFTDCRALVPLHQLRHPRVAEAFEEEEGGVSRRFAPDDVVAGDEVPLETLATDPAPPRNQIDDIFILAYLHHGLTPEVVDRKGRLRRQRFDLVDEERERPEGVEPITRTAVEVVEGHRLVPREEGVSGLATLDQFRELHHLNR